MGKRPDAIIVLIIINFIFYAITYHVNGYHDIMFHLFALYFPQNEHFRYWQLVTNMFMHGGFLHIFMNMYGLWAFGSPLEIVWGKKRFLFFYFAAGIGAGLIYTLVNYFQFQNVFNDLLSLGLSAEDINGMLETGQYSSHLEARYPQEKLGEFYSIYKYPAVGASGAIYGVLVAFGFLFPNSKLVLIFFPFPIAAKYFIPIVVALDLFSGVTGFSIFGGGIAHFAHVGGALIGFLLMILWRKKGKKINQLEEESTGDLQV
jgi:membrane associated rhomboid family serine protease